MANERSGLIVGLNKGRKTTAVERRPRISRRKGALSRRTAFVREIVKEVSGLAPYERRVIELLRNSQDKRARKLAKKRVSPSPLLSVRHNGELEALPAATLRDPEIHANGKRWLLLGTFGRAKSKVDEMQKVIAESRRAGGH
ncbi:ribosomal protein L36 [Ophidiomyces ophidiicola]|nr:ribosomal protein L36 [Ophidiomyces ophidiicola]